jgi:uncharacterized protein YjbI with pentapeptide repeats
MANADHLERLRHGADVWNAWRADPFGGAHSGADLTGADLHGAILCGADLYRAHLSRADLSGAQLSGACLTEADLGEANLSWADLRGAQLGGADLREADFCSANLSGAILVDANLSRADLSGADLTDCRIFGISAWRLTLSEDTKQQNLVITGAGEPEITVDNIEVAQFIYLLLHNEKIRDAIDTIGKKAVLILGRCSSRCSPRRTSPAQIPANPVRL